MATGTHTARLNFRLHPRHKRLIEKAAASRGQSVSEFAVAAMIQTAQQALQQSTTTHLSDRDRDIFMNMLDRGITPAAPLKRAARKHSRRRD